MLMHYPALADIAACRNAVKAEAHAQAFKECAPLGTKGDGEAQFYLGEMYDNGHGVPQDYREARRWYRLAAAKGHADAQFNLGVMYDNGHGVPQDYKEAVRWYRLAAEQGDVQAQFVLGLMYDNGTGVAQDYIQSHSWLNLAASARSLSEIGRHRRSKIAIWRPGWIDNSSRFVLAES